MPFEYSKITDYIYIGTNKCCSNGRLKRELLQKGIKAEISLERKKISSPFGAKFYLWLPTKEHRSPSFEQLLAGACFLKSLEDQKIKVYVHCEHGHGRSLTFVASYLILTKGLDVKEAIDAVKSKRPQVHINPIQNKALDNFEKLLKQRRLNICKS